MGVLHGDQARELLADLQAGVVALKIVASNLIGGQKQRLEASDQVQLPLQCVVESVGALDGGTVQLLIGDALDFVRGVFPGAQGHAQAEG